LLKIYDLVSEFGVKESLENPAKCIDSVTESKLLENMREFMGD